MQRLKLSNYRFLSLKYSVNDTCVSKYFLYNGKTGPTKSFNKSLKLPTISSYLLKPEVYCPINSIVCKRYKQTSTNQEKTVEENTPTTEEPPEKLSLFKRYRKMLKEYWYVLIPVHMVTSAVWFGGFYYAATRGLDIVPFLEYISLPEVLIKPLRSSSLGHIAVASALYKLATPARYMVSLGGSSVSVKFLTKRGLIRPAPTKAEIKTIIQNKLKKENISEKEK